MKIILPGVPIAKQRPKFGIFHGKSIVYDPQVKKEMKTIKTQILSQWPRQERLNENDCFHVSFIFLFPVCASESNRQKNFKLWNIKEFNLKPDLDNLEKLYCDCATGIIWNDDSQIVSMNSRKKFSENPRTEMIINKYPDCQIDEKSKEVLSIFSPSKIEEFLKDIHLFQEFSPEMIEEIITFSKKDHREILLTKLTYYLMEFSSKYANELKKIQRMQADHHE